MSELSLLSRLKKLDICIELEDGNLKIEASAGTLTPTLINELKEKKEDIIKFLQMNVQDRVEYSSIEPVEEKEYYALSSSQKRFYIDQQMDGESTVYNKPQMHEINEALDIERLEETFKKLIRRHESLRTSFAIAEETLIQRVHKEVEFKIRQLAGDGTSANFIESFVRPFDLSRAPLLRVGWVKAGERKYLLLVDMHHITSDYVSHQILVQDFMALNNGMELPPLRTRYKDFSEWQNRLFETGEIKKQEEYWLKEFEGDIPVLNLPYDYARPPIKSFEGNNAASELDTRYTGALKKMALEKDATLFMLMLAVYNIFLFKLSGQEDIIVATSSAGRVHADFQRVIGAFINSVPLRNYISPAVTFGEFLENVKQKTFEAFGNQDFQFEDLVNRVVVNRDEGRHPIMDVAFSLYADAAGTADTERTPPPPPVESQDPAQESDGSSRAIKTSKLDLTLFMVEENAKLSFSFEYCTKLFKEETIQRFISYFKQAVSSIVENPGQEIADIEIIPGEETKRVLFEFNNNEAEYSRERTIHQFIEKHAQSTPHRIAVGFDDEELTYRQINKRANSLALCLRERGIGKDQTVGILLKRSLQMLESILAAWKAGAAYIPIDTQYPFLRISRILGDSGAKALLTQSEWVSPQLKQAFENRVIRIDNIFREGECPAPGNLDGEVDMNALAYVIYTSGSTGKPKGAMVEHMGMMNHIQAKINDLQLTDESIVAQNASHTFDISVWQFFAALNRGGKTIIYPDEIVMNPKVFIGRIEADFVSILEVVPSYLSAIFDTFAMSQRAPELSLVYLLVTGEELKRRLVKKWFEIYMIKIVNAYGPTEASDDITHHILDNVTSSELIPIGKPLQNLNIYIVDENMNVCPIGVKGEICVSGVCVGRGYLNDGIRTQQVFMEDPFSEKRGVRLYKTGDLGRWLDNGTIEFFGRKDQQVKIRGFRIELGEIENKLVSHPAVNEAVVIHGEDEAGNRYLCAYLVPSKEFTNSEITEFLSAHLPDYMIPAHFVQLEQLPLTPNSKIDRKALPKPGRQTTSAITYVTEKMLAEAGTLVKEQEFKPSPERLEELHRERISITERRQSLLQEYSKQEGINYYPLSYAQQMIYYTEKTFPGTSCENLAFTVKYPGMLDKDMLEQAVNKTLYKNDGLRLHIVEMERGSSIRPVQYIADYKMYSLDYVDFSGEESDKKADKWISANKETPFQIIDSDLFYFAYIKFNEKDSGYYMKFHHLICDGITIHLLMEEINRHYESLSAGQPIDDSPNPSYIEYISDELNYLKSPGSGKDRAFWHHTMRPLPENASLSSQQGDFSNIKGEVKELPVPAQLRTRMHDYCRDRKTSLYKLVLSAFAIYMSRVTGLNDIVVGTVNHGRSRESHKRMMGIFIRFFPLRIAVDPQLTFQDFVEQVGKQVNHIIKNHQKYPFDILADEIRKDTWGDPRHWLNINLVGHPDVMKKERFKMTYHASIYQPNPLAVHINASNRNIDGILELEWNYQLERFSDSDILEIHNGLVNILTDAMPNPGKKISKLEMVSDEERQRILNQLSTRKIVYPEEMEIPHSFKPSFTYICNESGVMQPVGIAGELGIGGEGETNGQRFAKDIFREGGITYKSDQLARWLPDGDIEFLGKIDQQVWMEGTRISLEKIEKQLRSHGDIKDAAVVARQTKKGERLLCAYITSRKVLGESELREYLSGKSPLNMIPTLWVQLEKMPLTPDARINRRRLQTLEIDIRPMAAYKAPRGWMEAKLVEIWSEVLGIKKEKISITDNFFDLGGNSLNLIMLVSKIYKEFGTEVPVTQIYYNSTIIEIAKALLAKNISEEPVILLNRLSDKHIFGFPPQVGYGIAYMSYVPVFQGYSFYSFTFIEDEDRVEQYVKLITERQPEGPYIFFGYSSAGPLTFEVAKALEDRGYEVSDIIFADCYFSEGEANEADEEYMRIYGKVLDNFLMPFGADFLKDKVMEKSKKYMTYHLEVKTLEKINAKVHLIISQRTKEKEKNPFGNPHSWDRFTTKGTTVYQGYGIHREMFNPGPMEKNAAIFKEILNKIETKKGE